jgi:hypothetical protein
MLKFFRYTVCLALATLSAVAQGQERSLSAADKAKIQQVIASQIRAFERDEGVVAFSYATPAVRRHFGSPQAFMEMVKTDYELLFHNRSTAFLEAAVIEGSVIQPLRIISVDGEVMIALFTMELQANRQWRVSGCELAEATVQAV